MLLTSAFNLILALESSAEAAAGAAGVAGACSAVDVAGACAGAAADDPAPLFTAANSS